MSTKILIVTSGFEYERMYEVLLKNLPYTIQYLDTIDGWLLEKEKFWEVQMNKILAFSPHLIVYDLSGFPEIPASKFLKRLSEVSKTKKMQSKYLLVLVSDKIPNLCEPFADRISFAPLDREDFLTNVEDLVSEIQ